MPNILIADDHSIVRAGLKLLINNCIRDVMIDEAEDGEAVIRKMKSASFDLLVLDINMPHTESFSLTSYLLKEFPGIKIIIFTMNQEVFFAKRQTDSYPFHRRRSGDRLRRCGRSIWHR